MNPQHDSDDAGAHYLSSGVVVASLGTTALFVSFALRFLLATELPFLDSKTMGTTGLCFAVVGLAMIARGKRRSGSR